MIEIRDKSKCCGCSACYSVCPQHAISMNADEEGFLYPEVDYERCVKCGKCKTVCPILNPVSDREEIIGSYVVRTKDVDVLMKSTSGGVITPLAYWIFKNEGVLCAASYDENFAVSHIILDSKEAGLLKNVRGSKYVQSDMGESFQRIKEYLKNGRLVCFVGTGCQVNGLRSYLGEVPENLFTVDLVCHGTPSQKLWNKYLEYQKNKYHSEIKEINFRNKTYGYHSGTMKIIFENGKKYYGSARVDYMLRCFFNEISSRPICYECPFKTIKRCSDFTIYDCWHAKELISGLVDDDKGYTNVIVQSEKAAKVLEILTNSLEVYPVDTGHAIQLDGNMVCDCAIPHPDRECFYKEIDNTELPQHIQRYIPISTADRIIEFSKKFVYAAGIYNIMKKFFKR